MNNKKEKKNNFLIYLLTPLFIFILCVGILLVALIKPYNKASVYLNLAFMDEFKTNPNEDNGLIIKDGNIILDYTGETSSTGEITRPSFGEQFAVLRSDVLELDVPVYWGSSSELFERGACQATYSKLPGDSGNTIISAHEDTFFTELNKLVVGDVITLNTNYGEFSYTVTENITFKKTEKKYVSPTDETKLTLYTCKKDVLGASDTRIGVICELTEQKFYAQTEEAAEN